jgi:hypothetical protein
MRSLPIPDDVPDRPAIKAALAAGFAIPGCSLSRKTRLVVK